MGVWENDIVRDLSVRKAMNAAFWVGCMGRGVVIDVGDIGMVMGVRCLGQGWRRSRRGGRCIQKRKT